MYKAVISGSSYFLPEKIVTNTDLSNKYKEVYRIKFSKELTPELINKACGINERRYANNTDRLRDFATNAIVDLLEKTKVSLNEIDGIILATVSPESLTPSNASLVLRELCKRYKLQGLGITAYDVNSACSGFLFGLEQAVNYIKLGQKKKIIVCGVEILSRMLNGFDYHTGFLFGDGAAAVLIECGKEDDLFHINATKTLCITDDIDDITYYSSLSNEYDKRIRLNGSKVYRNGTSSTIQFINQYLYDNQLKERDFDYFIFHQSNTRMLKDIGMKLNIASEKILVNVDSVGNTAAASIPLCLAKFKEKNTFKIGNRILLCSFGAGYSLALADVNWNLDNI